MIENLGIPELIKHVICFVILYPGVSLYLIKIIFACSAVSPTYLLARLLHSNVDITITLATCIHCKKKDTPFEIAAILFLIHWILKIQRAE
jgi:hypothetical protein